MTMRDALARAAQAVRHDPLPYALTAASFVPGPVGWAALAGSAAYAAHEAGLDAAVAHGVGQAWQAYQERGPELSAVVQAAVSYGPIGSAQAAQSERMPVGDKDQYNDFKGMGGKSRDESGGSHGRRSQGRSEHGSKRNENSKAPAVARQPTPPKAPVSTPPVSTQPEPAQTREPTPAERQLRDAEERLHNAERQLDEELGGKTGHGRGTGPYASERQTAVDKAQAEVDKARRAVEGEKWSYANYVAGGLFLAAGLIGYRMAGAAGARAAKQAMEAVTHLNALGEMAAVLNKAKGVITGTPKGDALKGIVAAAKPMRGTLARAGEQLAKTAKFLNKGALIAGGVGATEVGTSAYMEEQHPAFAAALRTTGAIGLGLAMGVKTGTFGMAGRAAPVLRSDAVSALKAATARLEREAAGGAMKASHARVAKEVVGARRQLLGAKIDAKVGAIEGGHKVAKVQKLLPAPKRMGKAARAAEAQARKDAAAKGRASRAAKLHASHERAYELGHAHGQAQLGSRAGVRQQARQLGVRGRAKLGTGELRGQVAKAQARRHRSSGRAVATGAVHEGGRGLANPKLQALLQERRRSHTGKGNFPKQLTLGKGSYTTDV